MVDTCHAAGVKVIADAVFNHMSGSASGTGTAGTSYTHYVYNGYYESQDFHYCGLEPDNNIVNYDNALEVQTCQLDGLAEYVLSHPNCIYELICVFAASTLAQNTRVAVLLSTATI